MFDVLAMLRAWEGVQKVSTLTEGGGAQQILPCLEGGGEGKK